MRYIPRAVTRTVSGVLARTAPSFDFGGRKWEALKSGGVDGEITVAEIFTYTNF